jgi:hypothetical protein
VEIHLVNCTASAILADTFQAKNAGCIVVEDITLFATSVTIQKQDVLVNRYILSERIAVLSSHK